MIRASAISVFLFFVPLFSGMGDFTGGGALDSVQHGVIGGGFGETVRFGNSVLNSGLLAAVYSGLASFRDRLPPQAALLSPYFLSSRENFSLSFSAIDTVTGIEAVLFKYKVGGETVFHVDTLKKDNGAYRKVILGGSLSSKGFLFYAEAIDSEGNVAVIPDTAADSAHAIVDLPSGVSYQSESGALFPADYWRMVSVPMTLSDPSPLKLLEPLLGTYDEKRWKMVRWDGTSYVSLSADAGQGLKAGCAYFLYSRGKPFDFTTGAAKSTRIDRRFPLVLAPKRFAQISCPFAFPVAWRDFFESDSSKAASGIPLPLSDTYGSGAYLGLDTDPVLLPWRGYWAYNPGDAPCTLKVNPVESPVSKTRTTPPAGGFLLSLSLNKGNAVCLGAFAEKQGDLFLPPAVDGNAPEISFAGKAGAPDRLTDFMISDSSGNNRVTDGLMLRFNNNPEAVVAVNGCGTLPEAVILVDKKYGTIADLKPSAAVRLERAGSDPARVFTLICGSRAFVENRKAALIKGVPDTVVFKGGKPNPFNPRTVIGFGLPLAASPYYVGVRIFDVSGRLAKDLFRGLFGPGNHELVWDGRGDSGESAPSGIYFYTVLIRDGAKHWEKSLRLALVR
jgi:hypothetical protein